MQSPISKADIFAEYLLVDGCILSPHSLAFCAMHGPAKEDNLMVGQILYVDVDAWSTGVYYSMEPMSITVSPFNPSEIFVLGREGECIRLGDGSEKIYEIGDMTLPGPFRSVRGLNGKIFTVGEERGVWRFDDVTWEKIDAGMPVEYEPAPDSDEDEIVQKAIDEAEIAFAISSLHAEELCLVGTGGEIWIWNGARWNLEASPTNLNLYDVTTDENGNYVICGESGGLVIGRAGQWQFVPTNVEGNFCSVCHFNDKIYLANGETLFEWDGENVEAVDFGTDERIPAHKVTSGSGILLSIAAKEVMTTSDGQNWVSLLT